MGEARARFAASRDHEACVDRFQGVVSVLFLEYGILTTFRCGAMRLTFIGCPFKTSYGHYIDSLRKAIQAQYGDSIEWVGSNCGCGDPMELSRIFQGKPSAYFEMRHIGDSESDALWKRWLRPYARKLSCHVRADRYVRLAGDSDVMHFQQTLNAFGAMVAFRWLRVR